MPPEEVCCQGLEHLDGLGSQSAKVGKLRAVFTACLNGVGLKEVMNQTGCSRSAMSGCLNAIEREIGCPVIRGKRRALKTDALQSSRQERPAEGFGA